MAKKIHVSEDEQLEKVKKWWKDNGTGVITGIVMGLGLIVGFNWWKNHQADQALEASGIFSELLKANEAQQSDKVVELGLELKENYAKHDYAAKGVILAAVSQLKAGDADQAKENFNWVIDNSKLVDNQMAAKFRLARQLYREGDYDQALALVDVEQKSGFASQYFELIGDINKKQGDLEKAQQAYLKALENMSPASSGSSYREILQLKINNTAT